MEGHKAQAGGTNPSPSCALDNLEEGGPSSVSWGLYNPGITPEIIGSDKMISPPTTSWFWATEITWHVSWKDVGAVGLFNLPAVLFQFLFLQKSRS